MSLIEKAIDKLNQGTAGKGPGDPATEHLQEDNKTSPDVIGRAGELPATEHAQKEAEVQTESGDERSMENVGLDDVIKIDWPRLREIGMLTPDNAKSPLSQQYRLIKRPIIANAMGKGATVVPNGNLIMVTSALPGEGKTFSSINLALSIAQELDHTVLLVDADVARPSVARTLGISRRKGLIDVLMDQGLDLSEVLVKTDIPKLSLLPAGRSHMQSTELLASDMMRRIAKELSERYSDRIVIFDSPPLLSTSEAQVLAGLVGQVVMVVESERTQQHAVKEALARLNNGPEIIGFILNKATHSFGGGYYYKYGYYS